MKCKACDKSMTPTEAKWVDEHPIGGWEINNFETLCNRCLSIAMLYVPEADIVKDEQYAWPTKLSRSEGDTGGARS